MGQMNIIIINEMKHAGIHSWGFQISVTSLLSLQTSFLAYDKI